MAGNDLRECLLEHVSVERRTDLEQPRDVVDRQARHDAVEQEEPLLRKRERRVGIAVSRSPRDDRKLVVSFGHRKLPGASGARGPAAAVRSTVRC